MAEAAGGVRFPREERVDPRVAQARETLEQIYPGIGELYQLREYLTNMVRTLQGAKVDPRQLGELPALFSSVETQWRRHGASVLQPIHTEIAKAMNLERLSPRQANNVTNDFLSWLEADRTGERAHRYTNGDPALTQEYLDDYRSHFIQPFSIAGAPKPPAAAGLPPAPRGSGAPMAPGGGAPPAAAKDMDQAASDAWANLQAQLAGSR